MKRMITTLALLPAVGVLGLATATPADAATSCQGGTGSSRCITVSNVVKATSVVEAVPLQNKTKKTGTFHCSFTKTVSVTQSLSISVSAGIKAQVFGVAEASTSIDLTQSISQTGSQASSAGASFTLKAGESVVCQRIYSKVTASVKQVDTTSGKSETKYYSTTIPSSLGIRVVD